MNEDEAKILIVDDEPNLRAGLCQALEQEVPHLDVAETGDEGLQKFIEAHHDVVITDVRLPGALNGMELLGRICDRRPETCVIVITAYGSVEMAVEAMKQGAFDFVTKPVDLNVIRMQIRKALEHRRLTRENRTLRERLALASKTPEIIGNSRAIHELLRQIHQVARSDATVLLQGESGTGKELAARAIHQMSERREQPFVTVHLGALPDTLLESELFGHEKGAFTGAQHHKIGHFEAAVGGTIFLDEVTETSPRSQVDLLRVLEQREVQRLGGRHLIPVDVRVISASNQSIAQLVGRREFREDLFYRLNVVPILVPPLRERREDIPILVEHFLDRFCLRHHRPPKRLTPDAMNVLIHHNWPGNVRHLRNCIERIVVTVEGEMVHEEELPAEIREQAVASSRTLAHAVEEAEKHALLGALAACDCHRERTARMLNISVRTLHYKMNRYGLH